MMDEKQDCGEKESLEERWGNVREALWRLLLVEGHFSEHDKPERRSTIKKMSQIKRKIL